MKKDNLRHLVKSFLETHYKVSRPLLLGFSGGPDSLALLQLLMEDQKFPPLNLHLAHVDHRWRVESEEEAKSLEALAASLNLPFHLHVIENLDTGASNLEDLCRKERLRFFRSLNKTYQFEALILAHHLDDQAETVMKRVFEGSGILHLGGLKSVSQFQEMVIWRPMLSARKEEILHFLEQKGLQAIEDKTNLDTKYLRARMREMI
ncbi:MAG: tRNA lysidine(34) synthetase TilS, partial [Simkaniaceae bacterium]|nr:tRNA lysidine(34) synthetase TilS [Simkaniaceae bacterium]